MYWKEPENHKLSNWISLCYKWPAVCISLLLSDTKNWLDIFSNTPHILLEVLVNTQSQQRWMQEFGPFRLIIALIWSSFCEACTHYLKESVNNIIISLAILLFIPGGNISWIKHGNLSTHYDTWMTINLCVLGSSCACMFSFKSTVNITIISIGFFIIS